MADRPVVIDSAITASAPVSPAPDTGIHALEAAISRVLTFGVVLSLGCLLVGSALFFASGSSGYGQTDHDTAALTAHLVAGAFPRSVSPVLRGVTQGRAYAFISLGLLVLIATPVVRVAVTLIGFLRARDWRYTAITAIVLAVLLASFALGKVG